MQNPHAHTTHSNLRLRDANDAHILFQAVRQGHFQLIRRRLNGPEQQRLAPGHVYVWADREGALERWTDGHNWSPSRVRGAFLMYDEMPEPPEASFLRRKKPAGHPGEKVKHPRKKRLPPLPGGLSKQTYSATLMENGMPVQKWHLTAYFTDAAVPNLQTVEDDPILRQTVVPPNTFIGSMSGRRKSKSSKQPNHRENSESNVESADNSLVNSPVQEYATHGSYPLEGDSAHQWNGTPESRENTYDDSGSGSTASTGTIRDDPPGARRDSFGGGPVSPIFDQPPPPLSVPSGPPHDQWNTPFAEGLQAPDERRGSLASVDSSQSHTSTSTNSSGGMSTSASSRLYASSASSMSPVPNSHAPSSPWPSQYNPMNTSSFSSLAPWAGPASIPSSKPQQGYNLNSPFILDNPTSNTNFHPNNHHPNQQAPPFPTSSSGAQANAIPTPRQSNFTSRFPEFSSTSNPENGRSSAPLSQAELTFPQSQPSHLEISLSMNNESTGFGSSTPLSAPPVVPGPDNLPFSSHLSTAAFHQQQHQQNLRQRASTLSAVSSPLHQPSHGGSSPSAAAGWSSTGLYGWSPMATDDQSMHTASHTSMPQQQFGFTSASSAGNPTGSNTLGAEAGIMPDHLRTMNIPPPHRPSPAEGIRRASYQGSIPQPVQSAQGSSCVLTGEQYLGRASDVFESALQPTAFPFHHHHPAGGTTSGVVAVGSSSLEQSQAILHGRINHLGLPQRHAQPGDGLWGGRS